MVTNDYTPQYNDRFEFEDGSKCVVTKYDKETKEITVIPWDAATDFGSGKGKPHITLLENLPKIKSIRRPLSERTYQ